MAPFYQLQGATQWLHVFTCREPSIFHSSLFFLSSFFFLSAFFFLLPVFLLSFSFLSHFFLSSIFLLSFFLSSFFLSPFSLSMCFFSRHSIRKLFATFVAFKLFYFPVCFHKSLYLSKFNTMFAFDNLFMVFFPVVVKRCQRIHFFITFFAFLFCIGMTCVQSFYRTESFFLFYFFL